MTYREWAGRYYQSAMAVRERIEETKEKQKSARGDEAVLLGTKLKILTQMYYDCLDTYHQLVVREGEVD